MSPATPSDPQATDPWTGRLLGRRWRILSLLDDSGGMARVYLAEDERLPRKAVVKIPRTAQCNAEFAERFSREAHWHAQVANRNVVHILDHGEEQGTPFLVLQYLPGGNLKTWTERNPAFLADPRLHFESWLLPVAQALDAVAAQGIVHRDVKPSNILFDAAGQAYLSDFGIVKAGGEATMTNTGTFIGTLQFMSPEQCQPESKRTLDGRSDQYGLAVTVYQVLSGWKYPVEDDTAVVYAAKFGHVPMRPARDHDPRIPRAVDAAVMRALAPDRERRFASSIEFAHAVLEGLGAAGAIPEPERSLPTSETPLPPVTTAATGAQATGTRSARPPLPTTADRPTSDFRVVLWRWFCDLPDLALAAGIARLLLALCTTLLIGEMALQVASGPYPWHIVVALALISPAFVCGWGGSWGRVAAAVFLVLFALVPLAAVALSVRQSDQFRVPLGELWNAGEAFQGILGRARLAWSFVVGVAGGWLMVVCARPPGARHPPIVAVANVCARVALAAPALCWFVEMTADVFSHFLHPSLLGNLLFFSCACLPIPIVSLALGLGLKARSAAVIMIITCFPLQLNFFDVHVGGVFVALWYCWILALTVAATAGPGPGSVDRPGSAVPVGTV